MTQAGGGGEFVAREPLQHLIGQGRQDHAHVGGVPGADAVHLQLEGAGLQQGAAGVVAGGQVGLVDHAEIAGGEFLRRRVDRRRRPVHHPDPQVGRRRPGPGAPNPLGLDLVLGLAQPGGVGQQHLVARQPHRDLDHVPRGARGGGDDGGFPAGQGIEQGGLAGVGGAHQGDSEALSDPFAPIHIGQRQVQVGDQPFQVRPGAVGHLGGHLLVGEVDSGLEIGQGLDQLAAPALVGAAQGALHLGQGLAALRLGLGLDQVGDPLGLGQVQLAVLKSAAGELARLRQAQTQPAQRLQQG